MKENKDGIKNITDKKTKKPMRNKIIFQQKATRNNNTKGKNKNNGTKTRQYKYIYDERSE